MIVIGKGKMASPSDQENIIFWTVTALAIILLVGLCWAFPGLYPHLFNFVFWFLPEEYRFLCLCLVAAIIISFEVFKQLKRSEDEGKGGLTTRYKLQNNRT